MKRSSEIKSILSGRDISKDINLLKEAKSIISSGQAERMNDAVLYMISAENKIIDRLRLNGSLSRISSDMSLDNTLSFLEIYSNRVDIGKSFFKSADNMGFKIEKTSSRKSYESGSIYKWMSSVMGHGDGDSYDVGIISTFSNRRLLSDIRDILSKGSELHGRQPNILASAFEPANTRVFQTEAESQGLFEYAKLTLKIKDRRIKLNMAIKFGIAISTLFSNNQFQRGDAETKAKHLMIFQDIGENSTEAKKIRSSINFCLAKYDQDDGEELIRYLNSEHFITSEQRKSQLAVVISELTELGHYSRSYTNESNEEGEVEGDPNESNEEGEVEGDPNESNEESEVEEGSPGQNHFIRELLESDHAEGFKDKISMASESASSSLSADMASIALAFVHNKFIIREAARSDSRILFEEYMGYLSKGFVSHDEVEGRSLEEFAITVFELLFPRKDSCEKLEHNSDKIKKYRIASSEKNLFNAISDVGSTTSQQEMVNKKRLLALSSALCMQFANEIANERGTDDVSTEESARGVSFEDLMQLNKRGMQALLKNVDKEDLRKALKDVPPEILEFFLSNVSKRQAQDLREENEFSGPIQASSIRLSQENIVAEALKLMEEGVIFLDTGGAAEETEATVTFEEDSAEETEATVTFEEDSAEETEATVTFEEDSAEETEEEDSLPVDAVTFEEDSAEETEGNNMGSLEPEVRLTEEEKADEEVAEEEARASAQDQTKTTKVNRAKPLGEYFATETLSSINAAKKIIEKISSVGSEGHTDEAAVAISNALGVLNLDAALKNTEVKDSAKSFVETVLREHESYQDLAVASNDVESSSFYAEILKIGRIELEESTENPDEVSEVIADPETRVTVTYKIDDVNTEDIDSGIIKDVETSEAESLIDGYESEDKFLERVATTEFLKSSENMKKVVISLYNIAHERGLVKSYQLKEGVLKTDRELLKHYFTTIFTGKGNRRMSTICDMIFGSPNFLSENTAIAADMIYKCLKGVGAGIDEDGVKSYATTEIVRDMESKTIAHFSNNLSSIKDSIFDKIRKANLESYKEGGIESAIESEGYPKTIESGLSIVLLSEYLFNKTNVSETPERSLEIFLESMIGIEEFPTPVIESFDALLGEMTVFDENRTKDSAADEGLCNAYLFALREFLQKTKTEGSFGFFAFPGIANKKVRGAYLAPHTAFIVRFRDALEGNNVSPFSRKYSKEEMDEKFVEFKSSREDIKTLGSSDADDVLKAKDYIKQYSSSPDFGGMSDLAIMEDSDSIRSNLFKFAKERTGDDTSEENFKAFIEALRFSENDAEVAAEDYISDMISGKFKETLSSLFKKTKGESYSIESYSNSDGHNESRINTLFDAPRIYQEELDVVARCMSFYVEVIEEAVSSDAKTYKSPIEGYTRAKLISDSDKASKLLEFITSLKEDPMPEMLKGSDSEGFTSKDRAWQWPNYVDIKSCQSRSNLVVSRVRDAGGSFYPKDKDILLAESFFLMRELLKDHKRSFARSILSVDLPAEYTILDLIMSDDESFDYFDFRYVMNKIQESVGRRKVNLARYLNITNAEVFSIFVPKSARVALNAIDAYILGLSTSTTVYDESASNSITNSFTRRVATAIRKNDVKILEDEAAGYTLDHVLTNSFKSRHSRVFSWNCEEVVRNAFKSVIFALDSSDEEGREGLFGSREYHDNFENLKRVGFTDSQIEAMKTHLGDDYFYEMEVGRRDDQKFEIFKFDGKKYIISDGVKADADRPGSSYYKDPKIISIDLNSIESFEEKDGEYYKLLSRLFPDSLEGDGPLTYDKAMAKILGRGLIVSSQAAETFYEESPSEQDKSKRLYSSYERFAMSEETESYKSLSDFRKEYYELEKDDSEDSSERLEELKRKIDRIKSTTPYYLERSNVRLRNIKSSPVRLEGASFALLASNAGVDLKSIGNHRAKLLELEKVRAEFDLSGSIPTVYSEAFEDLDIFDRYLTSKTNELSSSISDEDDIISAKIQKTVIKKSIYSDGRISPDFLEKMFEVCFSESSVEQNDLVGGKLYSYPERYALININQTNLSSLKAAYVDLDVNNKDDISKRDQGKILTLLFGVREVFNNMVGYLKENEDRIEKEIIGSNNNPDKGFDRRNVNQAYAYSKIIKPDGEFKKYFLFKFHTDKDGLLYELVREMNTARGLYTSSEGKGPKTIERVKRMIGVKKAIFSRKKDTFVISENNYKGSGYMAYKATIELMRSFNISQDIIYIVEGLCEKLKELTYSIGSVRKDILPYFDKNILPLVFSNLDLYGYSTFKENTLSVLTKSIIYAQRGSTYSGEDEDLSNAIIYKDITVKEKEDILLEVSKFVDFSDLIHAELSEYSSDEKINTYVSYNAGLVLGGLSSLAKKETRSDNFTDDEMKDMSLLETIRDIFKGRSTRSEDKKIFWPTDEQKIMDWPYKVYKISGLSPALMEVAKSSSVNVVKALSPNSIKVDILGVLRSLNSTRPLFLDENDIMEKKKDDMLDLFKILNGIESPESMKRFEEGFRIRFSLKKEEAEDKAALLFSNIISLLNNMINISQLAMTDNSQETLEKLFIKSCKTISDDFLVKYFIYRNSKTTDIKLESKVKDILENIKKSFCAISAAKKALGSSRRPMDILNEELASEKFKLTKYYRLVDAIFSETAWQDQVKYTLMSSSVAKKTETAEKIKKLRRDNSEDTVSPAKVSGQTGRLLNAFTGKLVNHPASEPDSTSGNIIYKEPEETSVTEETSVGYSEKESLEALKPKGLGSEKPEPFENSIEAPVESALESASSVTINIKEVTDALREYSDENKVIRDQSEALSKVTMYMDFQNSVKRITEEKIKTTLKLIYLGLNINSDLKNMITSYKTCMGKLWRCFGNNSNLGRDHSEFSEMMTVFKKAVIHNSLNIAYNITRDNDEDGNSEKLTVAVDLCRALSELIISQAILREAKLFLRSRVDDEITEDNREEKQEEIVRLTREVLDIAVRIIKKAEEDPHPDSDDGGKVKQVTSPQAATLLPLPANSIESNEEALKAPFEIEPNKNVKKITSAFNKKRPFFGGGEKRGLNDTYSELSPENKLKHSDEIAESLNKYLKEGQHGKSRISYPHVNGAAILVLSIMKGVPYDPKVKDLYAALGNTIALMSNLSKEFRSIPGKVTESISAYGKAVVSNPTTSSGSNNEKGEYDDNTSFSEFEDESSVASSDLLDNLENSQKKKVDNSDYDLEGHEALFKADSKAVPVESDEDYKSVGEIRDTEGLDYSEEGFERFQAMLKAPSDFEDLKNKIGSEYANSIRPIIKTNKMSPSGFEFYMLEFLKLFEDISADYSARIKDIVSIFKYISGTFQSIIEKIYIENEDSNKIEILKEDTAIGRFTYLVTLKNRDFLSVASKAIISMYSKGEANQEDLREIEDRFGDIEGSIGSIIEDEGLSFEMFYNDDEKVDMSAYLSEALEGISKLKYEK